MANPVGKEWIRHELPTGVLCIAFGVVFGSVLSHELLFGPHQDLTVAARWFVLAAAGPFPISLGTLTLAMARRNARRMAFVIDLTSDRISASFQIAAPAGEETATRTIRFEKIAAVKAPQLSIRDDRWGSTGPSRPAMVLGTLEPGPGYGHDFVPPRVNAAWSAQESKFDGVIYLTRENYARVNQAWEAWKSARSPPDGA